MFKKKLGGKPGGGRGRQQKKRKETLNDKVSKFVDEFFSDSVGENDPGVAIGVFHKGQKAIKCVGAANVERKDKINSKTVFCLGSLSKPFIAVGIYILIDKEKLSIKDDVKKFIPDWKYDGITIQHLLNHTSGLWDYMMLCDILWKPRAGVTINHVADPRPTNEQVIQLFNTHQPPLECLPGKKERYSNTGYVVLAEIIRIVSEQPLAEFLDREIFAKLAMRNTFVCSHSNAPANGNEFSYEAVLTATGKAPQVATGYKPNIQISAEDLPEEDDEEEDDEGDLQMRQTISWKIKVENYLNSVVGDGGIYSTLDDLFLWCKALVDPVKSNLFFKHETVELATTPVKLEDGSETHFVFGQTREEIPGLEIAAFELDGSWVGFNAFINRIPDQDFFIVALANSDSNVASEVSDALTNVLVFNQE